MRLNFFSALLAMHICITNQTK